MGVKIAAIFPGQGSQVAGMGTDVAQRSSAAATLFDRASAILGYDLLELQATGPEDRLRQTQFSQPAIFTTNLALYYAAGDLVQPIVTAGHSFGELCSLTIAKSLSFDEALRIVDERAKAMQEAAEIAPGGMTAVIGLDAESIRTVIDGVRTETRARIQLANFNSPAQIVISGDLSAVQIAGELLQQAGAKRVVPLNVSGAWHSALMEPAVARFARAVSAADFAGPSFDVISNVDARPYRTVEAIRCNLVRSITDEVRWHDAAQTLLSYQPDLVVEFGATPVLGPLVRRLPNAPEVMNVTDRPGIEKLQQMLHESAA